MAGINLSSVYKNKDLRKKIFVLLACLGLFKLGMHVYVPGINRSALDGFAQDGLFSMMNTFTGGALANFSIFAVGIMPYITASIIIQLMQMDVIPILTEWRNQGAMGRKKLKKVTYVLTVIFALVQAALITVNLNVMYIGLIKNPSVVTFVTITVVLTLGTVILVVMGEIIERKGIGKGISMIILAGILMTLPDNLAMYYETEFVGGGNDLFLSIIKTILLLLFVYTLLLSVIVVNGGERRIPIQSSNSGKFGNMSKNKSFLPMKINASGVIPVIFASALFMMPVTISQLIGDGVVTEWMQNYLGFNSFVGIAIYAAFIMMFTYFYAFIQVDPEKIADNLHKNNSFVPGIRPGKHTQEYFTRTLTRLTFVGSIFLATIAILPMVLGKVVVLPQQLMMSGTSLIIVVTIIVDLKSQLQVEMAKSNYSSFTPNKPVKHIWGQRKGTVN